MAEDKIFLPSSGGGIMRYSDETTSKLKISPTTVVVIIAIVIVVALILHAGAFGIFG